MMIQLQRDTFSDQPMLVYVGTMQEADADREEGPAGARVPRCESMSLTHHRPVQEAFTHSPRRGQVPHRESRMGCMLTL